MNPLSTADACRNVNQRRTTIGKSRPEAVVRAAPSGHSRTTFNALSVSNTQTTWTVVFAISARREGLRRPLQPLMNRIGDSARAAAPCTLRLFLRNRLHDGEGRGDGDDDDCRLFHGGRSFSRGNSERIKMSVVENPTSHRRRAATGHRGVCAGTTDASWRRAPRRKLQAGLLIFFIGCVLQLCGLRSAYSPSFRQRRFACLRTACGLTARC